MTKAAKTLLKSLVVFQSHHVLFLFLFLQTRQEELVEFTKEVFQDMIKNYWKIEMFWVKEKETQNKPVSTKFDS